MDKVFALAKYGAVIEQVAYGARYAGEDPVFPAVDQLRADFEPSPRRQ